MKKGNHRENPVRIRNTWRIQLKPLSRPMISAIPCPGGKVEPNDKKYSYGVKKMP
jgi:hypothetical protein